MKYLNREEEAEFINRHFSKNPFVTVTASGLWDTDLGDPETQITVDIVAPRAKPTIEAESERFCALVSALAELESLPIVKSAKLIGMVDSDNGTGGCHLLTLNLDEWRVGTDGRLYRH